MISLNNVVIAGNLARDPEVKFLQSGTAVCNITVAVNHNWMKDGERKTETAWCQCVVFGKSAEWCGENLKKGSNVLVAGRLKTDEWEKDGKKQSILRVIVERIQSAEKKEKPETSEDIPF